MAQAPIKAKVQKPVGAEERQLEERKLGPKALVMGLLVGLAFVLILVSVLKPGFFQSIPGAGSGANALPTTLQPPTIPSGPGVPTAQNMGMPGAQTSITSLQAPLTAPQMKQFYACCPECAAHHWPRPARASLDL